MIAKGKLRATCRVVGAVLGPPELCGFPEKIAGKEERLEVNTGCGTA